MSRGPSSPCCCRCGPASVASRSRRSLRSVRCAAGNDAFAAIARPSPGRPLTVCDLIDAAALPSLYGMLALALHHVGIVEAEAVPPPPQDPEDGASASAGDDATAPSPAAAPRPPSPSHLSITLPCRRLRDDAPVRHDVTVSPRDAHHRMLPLWERPSHATSRLSPPLQLVFMNDLAPMRRCFLGILTARAPDRGDRGAVDDESLLTRSTAGGGRALPRGRMFRVADDRLCRALLGPEAPA